MPPQYYDDCSWQYWPTEKRDAFDKLCRTLNKSGARRQKEAAISPRKKDELHDDLKESNNGTDNETTVEELFSVSQAIVTSDQEDQIERMTDALTARHQTTGKRSKKRPSLKETKCIGSSFLECS